MRLHIISRIEYVLSSKEFKIEKEKKKFREKDFSSNNQISFSSDLAQGELDRYSGTYVAYKDGILCGQSNDEITLKNEVNYTLCIPNVDIFKVPIEE